MWLATLPAVADIALEGLADRQGVLGSATFRIVVDAGYSYTAQLDGAPVAVGEWVRVTTAGYHELAISRVAEPAGEVENRLVRFVVISSERLWAEYGLFPWTPHTPLDSAPGEFAEATLELIVPRQFPQNLRVPLITLTERATGRAAGLNGVVQVGTQAVRLKRGYGFGFLPACLTPESVNVQGRIQSLAAQRAISIEAATAWQTPAAEVASDTTWPANSRIHVTSNLTVREGATLTIGAGTVVALEAGVDVTIEGRVVVAGSRAEPVVFAPAGADALWGGFLLWKAPAQADITGAIFTGSGANRNWFVGRPGFRSHRPEQALLHVGQGAQATLTDCYVIENAGQAFHGEEGFLVLDRCLVQRCQMVGQFNGGSVQITRSALLDCPSDDGVYVDGDNDAVYFTLGTHRLTDTLIGWTKDDGVDAGASEPGEVVVERCWFESCFHEGMALSGANKVVRAEDSVFLDNEQGVEAGYYSPLVTVQGSLFLANEVGGRFGDNYAGFPHDGFLRATNSFFLYNEYRDVWGYVPDLWAEDLTRMDVRGNYLTGSDPLHPDNVAWEPQPAGEKLARFRTTAGVVAGAGFYLAESTNNGTGGAQEVRVGLSTFSPEPVVLDYAVEGGSARPGEDFVLESGTLRFSPGEVVKRLLVRVLDNPRRWAARAVEIGLRNPVNAEFGSNHRTHRLTILAPERNLPLAPAGSSWRFFRGRSEASAPRSAWRQASFDEAGWEEGSAPLGYGLVSCQTSLTDMRLHYTSVFLRKTFVLDMPEAIGSLEFQGTASDGFILWLNGQELTRQGVAGGDLSFDATAGGATDEVKPWEKGLTASDLPRLLPGTNVVAVQLFNDQLDSPSLYFDLGLTARAAGDLDGDGLPDAWELMVVNALPDDAIGSVADVLPEADFDGDGFTNLAEFVAGTDPVARRSNLALGITLEGAGGVRLIFGAQPGRRYRLASSDTLEAGFRWRTVAEVAAGPEPRSVWWEDTIPAGPAWRFYRVQVAPYP
jgi:hypothetical protein